MFDKMKEATWTDHGDYRTNEKAHSNLFRAMRNELRKPTSRLFFIPSAGSWYLPSSGVSIDKSSVADRIKRIFNKKNLKS